MSRQLRAHGLGFPASGRAATGCASLRSSLGSEDQALRVAHAQRGDPAVACMGFGKPRARGNRGGAAPAVDQHEVPGDASVSAEVFRLLGALLPVFVVFRAFDTGEWNGPLPGHTKCRE